MNKVIKILIFSDFFIFFGFGLFAPIFAIFITKQILNADIVTVGIATMIYWIVTSFLRIPVSKFLDKTDGEFDDFISLILGSFILIFIPILYIFAKTPIHIFLIETFYGLGTALAIPPWYAIFTRHINKTKEAFNWSIETISVGIGSSISALIGSWIAEHYGFQIVFILSALLNLIGAIILGKIFYHLKKEASKNNVLPINKEIL